MKIALLFVLVSAAQAQSSWLNFPVPGIPRTPDGKVNVTAATPKASNGKPDLSGVWSAPADYFKDLATDLKPEDVPMLWRQYAFHGYLALQRVDEQLLEPRLPPAIFYNLLLAARKG